MGKARFTGKEQLFLHSEAWHLQEVLLIWFFLMAGGHLSPYQVPDASSKEKGLNSAIKTFSVILSLGILLMACEFSVAKAKILFLRHKELWILFCSRSLCDVIKVTFH